jgi:L-lactate dehydrogenase
MRLKDYCPICPQGCNYNKALDNIFKEVKDAAYKIIRAKGATYYAIGVALVRVTEAILRDENSVFPISVYLDNYLGIKDIYLSVPTILNKKGVDRVLALSLDKRERENLHKSARRLKEVIREVGF